MRSGSVSGRLHIAICDTRKGNGFPNPASPTRLDRLSAVVLAVALAGTAIGLTHGRAWGEDRFGQLGNGESGPGAISSVPVEVSELFSYLPPPSGEAGDVRFAKTADTSFDSEDTEANAAWINEHFARMLTHAPFFDSRASWYPRAWAYKDAYAICVGGPVEKEHPSWILRGPSGEKLCIPFDKSQDAADITNAAFRKYWITQARSVLEQGYKGIFADDVDMWLNVEKWNSPTSKFEKSRSTTAKAKRSPTKAGGKHS